MFVGAKLCSLHRLADMIRYNLHCCLIVVLVIILFNNELLSLSAEADCTIK